MKATNMLLAFLALRLGLVAVTVEADVEGRAMGSGPGEQFSGSFSKLFGENKFFTAEFGVETHKANGETQIMTWKFSYAEGKSRMERDIAQEKGPKVDAEFVDGMKEAGLAKSVQIIRPDTNYTIYPDVRAYMEEPGEKPLDDNSVKMVVTELGPETSDGQACVKSKVILAEENGRASVCTVWRDKGLKDFPIRIEVSKGAAKGIFTYKNVVLAKPDPKLFEPPPGFKRFPNLKTLVRDLFEAEKRKHPELFEEEKKK
jgi:hypothetical protein